jgi:BolA family transcriptional regulator, general stress-responsive regulator|tara:strand:- start:127 stop:402 length:276 start_codon:yes stop_codon:yes gene_type:complete
MLESNRIEMIRYFIETELAPSELEIIDESHMHAGHSGHGGAGHFKVRIVSEKFDGQLPLARHRMVYAAVNSLMPLEIHALSIEALATGENT